MFNRHFSQHCISIYIRQKYETTIHSNEEILMLDFEAEEEINGKNYNKVEILLT